MARSVFVWRGKGYYPKGHPWHETGHPRASELGCVNVADLGDEPVRLHEGRQPVFTDRYMEGTRSPVDGTDIGSREKRRQYMAATGYVDASDYSESWYANKREERAREADRQRRADVVEQVRKISRY
jgi:hypothetical protein